MRTVLGTGHTAGGLVLAAACLIGGGISWSSDSAPWHLEERRVAKLGGIKGAAISPDGESVAIYIVESTYQGLAGPFVSSRLEIHDVDSLKTVSVIDLPRIEDRGFRFNWSEPVSKVHYCDRGKYILIYLGDGVSSVINLQAGQKATSITIERPPETQRLQKPTLLAASCAAESNLVAFDVVSHPENLSHIELFNIESGKQIKELPGGSVFAQFVAADVSPSGDRVLAYAACLDDSGAGGISKGVRVFDVPSSALLKTIDTGFVADQAKFIGESSIAVAGEYYKEAGPPVIKIFELQSGALTSSIGDAKDAPIGAVGLSADGRFLFAYTGIENHCETCDSSSRGYLQIKAARFSVWDLTTGKVIARSPKIPAYQIRGGFLGDDKKFRTNERPRFQFSRSGNAVLVTHTNDEFAIDVFLLK